MVSEQVREKAAEIVAEHEEAWTEQMRGNVEGGPCTLCGCDEYAVQKEAAECAVEGYETVCRWGYEIEARVLVVEIPYLYGTEVHVHLLEAECENHGEDVQFSATDIRREIDAHTSEAFELEVEALIQKNPIEEHHVSYQPEETIQVCKTCHNRIHNEDDYRPDLTPDLTRAEWVAVADG